MSAASVGFVGLHKPISFARVIASEYLFDYSIPMAVMAPSVPEIEDPPRLPVTSRNPLPLSASQKAQVREVYHARVRAYCAAEIKGTNRNSLSDVPWS